MKSNISFFQGDNIISYYYVSSDYFLEKITKIIQIFYSNDEHEISEVSIFKWIIHKPGF